MVLPGGKTSLRILIVDDHEIVRRGVRQVLAADGLEVCGEAENGKVAVEKVQLLEPDVVVLDVSMPIMTGFEAAKLIKRISPSTKIVFLTMHDDSAMTEMMKTTGADAFVRKMESADRLVSVLRGLVAIYPRSHIKSRSEIRVVASGALDHRRTPVSATAAVVPPSAVPMVSLTW